MWCLLCGSFLQDHAFGCRKPRTGHNATSPHGERCNAALLLRCAHPCSLFVSAPCGVEELNHGSAVHCADTTRLDFQMWTYHLSPTQIHPNSLMYRLALLISFPLISYQLFQQEMTASIHFQAMYNYWTKVQLRWFIWINWLKYFFLCVNYSPEANLLPVLYCLRPSLQSTIYAFCQTCSSPCSTPYSLAMTR